MARDGRHDDLTAFLAARGDALLRTAVLLAPGREAGEDLLQEALERLIGKWHKVDGDPEAYLRRIMYNRAVDGWRTRARFSAFICLSFTRSRMVSRPSRMRWPTTVMAPAFTARLKATAGFALVCSGSQEDTVTRWP